VKARDYLSELIDRILENFPAVPTVHVHKRLGEFTLAPGQIQPLGILLNELLTNTMKYAFRGRVEGTVDIAASADDSMVTLSVADDGPGLPEGVNFETSKGFGLQLVALLTRQLEGQIRVEREQGTRIVVTFPTVGP
jgi:two-component sensor histidine kinase